MKKLTILFLWFFSLLFGAYAENKHMLVIDISEMDEAEMMAVLSFQGLANREEPNIFVKARNKNMWGMAWKNWYNNLGTGAISNEVFEKYEATEDVFIEYYEKTFGFTFEEVTFEEALAALEDTFKGVIMYTHTRSSSPAGISIALTAAAVEDAIPATQAVLAKFPRLHTYPVIKNFHLQFDDKYAAYDYAITEYKDKVSKDFLHSYDLSNDGHFSVDYAVQMKMFTSDLSFDSPVAVSGDPDNAPVNMTDTEKLNKICEAVGYNPASSIWGWAPPTEYALIRRAGELGMVVLCNNQPNASFHAAVKVPETSFKQKRQIHSEDVVLENKVYIAFESNEGDTYKCLGGLMNEGTWMQKRRGEVKMNWGTNPRIFQLMPALMKFYYDNLTDQDYFFNATAGIGYVDAGLMTNAQREEMARQNKLTSEYCDTHHIDIWWYREADWVAQMGLVGQQSWETYQSVTYPKVENRIPVINYDISYDLTSESFQKRPENLALYLAAMGNNEAVKDGPWFEIVYAIDPEMAYNTMQILEAQYPGRFEAVCLDEMFILAEKAQEQIEGKTVRRDTNLYNQLIEDNKRYYSFIDLDFDTPSGLIDRTSPQNLNVNEKDGKLIIEKKDNGVNWGFCYRIYNYDFDKYPVLSLRIPEGVQNAPFFLKLAEVELRLERATVDENDRCVYSWNVKEIVNRTGFVENIQLQVHMDNPKAGDRVELDYIKSIAGEPTSLPEISQSSVYIHSSGKLVTVEGLPEGTAIEIIDMLGKRCLVTYSKVIDMNSFPTGIYIVKNSNGQSVKFMLK
ncbi:MAG: hypothetical protein LUG18_06940 [Candidatus Azobacteroides sp.]|nr:hypothetical protein [Candidatus Azobacteroides sp.]